MAYDSYNNFRTAIYTRLDITTTDLTTTSMDDLIKDAEDVVNRQLRVAEMETAFNDTVTTNDVIPVPAAYLEAKNLYLDASPQIALSPKTAEWIRRNYPTRSSTGRPAFFAKEGSNFIFGPPPDSAYTMQGIYYAKPNSLPGTTTINAVFTAYPSIYLSAACAEVERFLRRFQEAAMWDQRTQILINLANEQSRKREFSGGPLQIRAE